MHVVVAFARVGPLQRLAKEIAAWRGGGKTIHAVFGIDDNITSAEAIGFGLTHFTEIRIAHVPGTFSPIFHPKIYAFAGPRRALAFIGSNNLTTGGLETNFETCIELDMALPADQAVWNDVRDCVKDAKQAAILADAAILAQLMAAGVVCSEATRPTRPAANVAEPRQATLQHALPAFPSIHCKPPSAIPRAARAAQSASAGGSRPGRKATAQPQQPTAAPSPLVAQTLVMQIVPHHNGEVLLSMLAVDQNPTFFGWPFTGTSVPKKPTNRPYPQREPDPVVDITVYDTRGAVAATLTSYSLNLVYYTPKSEVRMTIQQSVAGKIPATSILVMRQGPSGLDYTMHIHAPGGPTYNSYLQVCNQTMPSGGRSGARKFGWL